MLSTRIGEISFTSVAAPHAADTFSTIVPRSSTLVQFLLNEGAKITKASLVSAVEEGHVPVIDILLRNVSAVVRRSGPGELGERQVAAHQICLS